jgi:hypothetical protein
MRCAFLILLSFMLVLQMQGGASLLGLCVSHVEACAMDTPTALATPLATPLACGCEHEESSRLPFSSGEKCPADCLRCDLGVPAAEAVVTMPPNLRSVEANCACAPTLLRLSMAEWLPAAMPLFVGLNAPPNLKPTTVWGVWRL